MAKIELVKRVKYAGDIHKKLTELGWDSETAALFCDDLPDADVAPVRHEWWISASISGIPHYRCTGCGEYIESTWTANFDYRYCPNCGARMDLGGADNEN